MGAGKSTIGRQIAARLNAPFYDSDKVLEQRTGVDVATVFAYEGEAGFRLREQRIIDELTLRKGIVLATGGGAILEPGNRQLLKSRGLIVYLHVSIETQLARTSHDRTRPLLNSENRRQTLEILRQQREPLYQGLADITVDTDINNIPAVIKCVLMHIKNACQSEFGQQDQQ